MDNLYKSLNQYFKILERTGYLSPSSVNRLLAYIMILEFFEQPLYYYITEEDYKYLQKALYCLYGKDCLIPYPTITENLVSKPILFYNTNCRISQENDTLRVTEDQIRKPL